MQLERPFSTNDMWFHRLLVRSAVAYTQWQYGAQGLWLGCALTPDTPSWVPRTASPLPLPAPKCLAWPVASGPARGRLRSCSCRGVPTRCRISTAAAAAALANPGSRGWRHKQAPTPPPHLLQACPSDAAATSVAASLPASSSTGAPGRRAARIAEPPNHDRRAAPACMVRSSTAMTRGPWVDLRCAQCACRTQWRG